MNFRHNKSIAKVILTIILMLFCSIPSASAYVSEINSCEDVNFQEKTKGAIITVLEESIGSGAEAKSASNPDTKIFNCFRETFTENDSKASYYSTTCSSQICQKVQIIVSSSGISLLFTYLSLIYKWSASVIGIVSVAYIAWGGIQISMAGGDSSAIEEGKKKIIQSLGGLALLFMSAVILYTINPNFFTL